MQILGKVILNVSIFLAIVLNYVPLYAQDFEGEILFKRESLTDTSFYTFKIKEEKVRFEELNKNMELDNYMIIDLSKKKAITINPKRKLYSDLPVYPWNGSTDTSNFKIIKTGNYKIIEGYKCFQYRVQNKKEDTEVTYWFAEGNYDFYSKTQKMLNQSEKIAQYYLNIPQSPGQIPFESVERSMLREWRMCSQVVKIEKKTLQASLFDIPKDYKMFQKN